MGTRGSKLNKLTGQQKRFLKRYLQLDIDTKKREEIAALYAGYSEKTAYAQGRRLVTHPVIKEAIMHEHPRKLIEISNINSAWVLFQWANMFETPLSDLFDEDGSLKAIPDMSIAAQRLVSGITVTTVRDDTTNNKTGTTTIRTRTTTSHVKLIDRLRVIEDIAKHVDVRAFNADRLEDDKNESIAALMRAFEKLQNLDVIDITPEEVHGNG